MSVGNVQARLGCLQPDGATVYLPDETYFTATHSAAQADLLELAETINGLGLDQSIAADLSATARTGATQATVPGQSACLTVAELSRKITADTGRNGGPTADQAATLKAPMPRIRGELGC
jgi:hypothetical protein